MTGPRRSGRSDAERRHELAFELGETRLRPIRPEDSWRLFPVIHERPEVLRWISWDGPSSVEDLAARYEHSVRFLPSSRTYLFAVADLETDSAIGEATLEFVIPAGSAGHSPVGVLGFWLGEEAQGKGHGARLVELLTHVGFESLGARALTAGVLEGNERSLTVLERTGFVRQRAAPNPKGVAWDLGLTRRAHGRRVDRPPVKPAPSWLSD